MSNRYELDPLHRNTPDAEFLDDLNRVAKSLEVPTVTISQYNEHGRFHASTIQRRFGSWRLSLERANLDQPVYANYSDEQLFDNLVEVWTHIGRQPRLAEITSRTSSISGDTYRRRFGSWRKALEAFVLWANQTEQMPPLEIEAQTAQRHRTPRRINDRLRFLVMRRDNFKCRITGRSPATDPSVVLEVDHIIPWDKGGETEFDNLQTLAKNVNIGKSNLGMSASDEI